MLRSVVALIGFAGGAAIAASIVGSDKGKSFWSGRIMTTLALESAALLLFCVLYSMGTTSQMVYIGIVLLSLAMGIQTTIGRKWGVAGISTTVLTNNLANAIEDVVARLRMRFSRGNSVEPWKRDSILRILAVVVYAVGAILGTVAEYQFPLFIIWVPGCILAGIALTAIIRYRSLEQGQQ